MCIRDRGRRDRAKAERNFRLGHYRPGWIEDRRLYNGRHGRPTEVIPRHRKPTVRLPARLFACLQYPLLISRSPFLLGDCFASSRLGAHSGRTARGESLLPIRARGLHDSRPVSYTHLGLHSMRKSIAEHYVGVEALYAAYICFRLRFSVSSRTIENRIAYLSRYEHRGEIPRSHKFGGR